MFKKSALIAAVAAFAFCFYSLYAVKTPTFAAYADEFEIYLNAGSFGNNAVITDALSFSAYTAIKGESCTLTATYAQVLEDFNATHLFSEVCDEGESCYAYSPRLPYKTVLYGRTVNIHYFKGKTANKIGTPLIFGGF